MTSVGTFRLTLPAPMLRRGFWLYVWSVTTAEYTRLLYVGRTGDNSSPNASPAYIRMGQHLGSVKTQNSLRKHLLLKGIDPQECRCFDLIAHGPVYPEVARPEDFDHADTTARAALMKQHLPFRDIVGAMEKRLADELSAVGYTVMNRVKWRHTVTDEQWLPIRQAFAEDFCDLKALP